MLQVDTATYRFLTDTVERLLDFPESLTGADTHLKFYVQFILQALQVHFLILPPSEFHARNPRQLPREELRGEVEFEEGSSIGAAAKKTGRPSKAEKSQKIRTAVTSLEQWVENNTLPLELVPASTDPAGAAGLWRPGEEVDQEVAAAIMSADTTHVTLSQRPIASRNLYREKKATALNVLEDSGHMDAVDRAGSRVLRRLKEIDAAAAARGLEVGTEGGELSAIGRVEKAVNEKRVLSLLEGGGLT